MEREEKKRIIIRLCSEAGCDEKAAKRHLDLFVNQQWNVHPSKRFTEWWKQHGDGATTVITAYNCQDIRDNYMDAKGVGVA